MCQNLRNNRQKEKNIALIKAESEIFRGMNSYFGEAGCCGTQVSTYCWGQGGKKPESFRAATSL